MFPGRLVQTCFAFATRLKVVFFGTACENLAREFECVTWHSHFRHNVRRIFTIVVMSLSSPNTRDINGSCLFKTDSLSQNKDLLHETNTNCNVQSVRFSAWDKMEEFGLRGTLKMYHSYIKWHIEFIQRCNLTDSSNKLKYHMNSLYQHNPCLFC